MHANIYFKTFFKASIFVRRKLKARSKQLYVAHEEITKAESFEQKLVSLTTNCTEKQLR